MVSVSDLATYTAFFDGNIKPNYETKEKEMVNGQAAIYDSLIDIPFLIVLHEWGI